MRSASLDEAFIERYPQKKQVNYYNSNDSNSSYDLYSIRNPNFQKTKEPENLCNGAYNHIVSCFNCKNKIKQLYNFDILETQTNNSINSNYSKNSNKNSNKNRNKNRNKNYNDKNYNDKNKNYNNMIGGGLNMNSQLITNIILGLVIILI